MNVIENEMPYLIEAKTCRCNDGGKSILYHFIESAHGLCIGKDELMLAQIKASERLLKYANDDEETLIIKDEITRLKLASDLIRY